MRDYQLRGIPKIQFKILVSVTSSNETNNVIIIRCRRRSNFDHIHNTIPILSSNQSSTEMINHLTDFVRLALILRQQNHN